jgi:hypothetical protein
MSRTYRRHAYNWYQYSSTSYLRNAKKEEGEFNYQPRPRHTGCSGSRYFTSHWEDVTKSVHYDHYSHTNVDRGERKTSKQREEIKKLKARKDWRRERSKVKVGFWGGREVKDASYKPKTTSKPPKQQFYKPNYKTRSQWKHK